MDKLGTSYKIGTPGKNIAAKSLPSNAKDARELMFEGDGTNESTIDNTHQSVKLDP